MANNRMFLLHRPSGNHLYLGKRMLEGWYDAPYQSEIRAFYDKCEAWGEEEYRRDGPQRDDFALVMEDVRHAPLAKECDWDLSDGDNPKLIIKEPKGDPDVR